MILPLFNQQCIVEWRGNKHLGVAERAYLNHFGQYRITVWSRSWGYGLDFKATDITLVSVVYENGEQYDAHGAFLLRYDAKEQMEMEKAESTPAYKGTETGRSSGAVPQKSNTPKPEGPPNVMIRRVRRPG